MNFSSGNALTREMQLDACLDQYGSMPLASLHRAA